MNSASRLLRRINVLKPVSDWIIGASLLHRQGRIVLLRTLDSQLLHRLLWNANTKTWIEWAFMFFNFCNFLQNFTGSVSHFPCVYQTVPIYSLWAYELLSPCSWILPHPTTSSSPNHTDQWRLSRDEGGRKQQAFVSGLPVCFSTTMDRTCHRWFLLSASR